MTKKTDTCTLCGKPLGPARMTVSKGAIEGPAGMFCLPTSCFELAWQVWLAHSGRLGVAPVRGEERGAGMGAAEADGTPRPLQGGFRGGGL